MKTLKNHGLLDRDFLECIIPLFVLLLIGAA